MLTHVWPKLHELVENGLHVPPVTVHAIDASLPPSCPASLPPSGGPASTSSAWQPACAVQSAPCSDAHDDAVPTHGGSKSFHEHPASKQAVESLHELQGASGVPLQKPLLHSQPKSREQEDCVA